MLTCECSAVVTKVDGHLYDDRLSGSTGGVLHWDYGSFRGEYACASYLKLLWNYSGKTIILK